MDNIKPFIDLGWNTVPLKGKIKRNDDGTKTIPSFEDGWREKYLTKVNTNVTKLGGTMTGKQSNIVAIDCDNSDTYAIFKALDPDYEFIFLSKGKGKVKDDVFVPYTCGTFIYKYDEELALNFSINNGSLALDFYANNGFIYLPTTVNESKEPLLELPEIKEMPAQVKMILQQLHTVKNTPTVVNDNALKNISSGNCLAPLVEQFTTSGEFMPGLFRIITPKDFRSEPEYVTKGYLNPTSIPEGRGSEYLSKVSAILGADISVSMDLYASAIHKINQLWASPMDEDKLDKTICDPMISSKASINGNPIWKYDEQWKKSRLVLHTKRQSNVELGFDDNRNIYYCIDIANENVKSFTMDTQLQSYIEAVAINAPKKAEVKRAIPIINVCSNPSMQFGFNLTEVDNERTLNLFSQTPELNILRDPETYHKFYTRPSTILNFMTTLVPDDTMRTFLLQFIKRKLTRFEYSPIILYFLGVHGSGKDTFVQILETIMGTVARPTVKDFLEIYNGWLLDTYFVQLDEYGNQLTRIQDKEEALGKLKSYTGKSEVQIRTMRADGFAYKHYITFIMTANKNPLMFEDGDRRVALLPTPNKLNEAQWVRDAGGVSAVYGKILTEIKDFCYYLATEVDEVSSEQFVVPPESAAKHTLIADSMYASQRIAYALKNKMFDYLITLAIDMDAKKVVTAIKAQRLLDSDLEQLYDNLTEMQGDMRSLNKAIRNAGIAMHKVTGSDAMYYDVFNQSPFEEE